MIATRRWLLLAAAALLAAACSVSRLAYLNAPPLAVWYIDGYVDMSDAQKGFVKERLTRAMAWHRQAELPQYRRAIEGLIVKTQVGVPVEDVRATYAQARDYYHRAIAHLIPDIADFLLLIDEAQLAHLEKRFADDNRKLVKESVQGTADDRRAKRAKKLVDQFEEWTGTLSPPQREIVVNGARSLADNTEERIGDRRYRQREIVEIIRAKPPRDEVVARLRKMLIETDSWRRPEYTRKLRERDEQVFAIVSEVTATLTPEQRAHLHGKMRSYVNDISAIIASR